MTSQISLLTYDHKNTLFFFRYRYLRVEVYDRDHNCVKCEVLHPLECFGYPPTLLLFDFITAMKNNITSTLDKIAHRYTQSIEDNRIPKK